MPTKPNDSVNKRTRDDSGSANDGGATPQSANSDTANREAGHTKTGQEAVRGVGPGAHDDEHQSQYGGGGENGGSNTKH